MKSAKLNEWESLTGMHPFLTISLSFRFVNHKKKLQNDKNIMITTIIIISLLFWWVKMKNYRQKIEKLNDSVEWGESKKTSVKMHKHTIIIFNWI